MQVHARARLTPKGRLFVVKRVLEEGWSPKAAADAAGVSERTVYRWLARYRSEGEAGLADRPPIPKLVPHRTPGDRVKAILALRRLRMTGPEISELLEMPPATVSAVLLREGLGKLSRLSPPEPPNRYERARPGELIHVDVKRLARIGPKGPGHRVTGRRHHNRARRDRAGRDRRQVGWEFVHVAVDDATRLAYAEVLPNERGATAAGFLRRAFAFFAAHGIAVERVMTDNGSPYVSTVHAIACRELGIRHLRTRPRRPRTNGKAERFIQTMLRGWAYGAVYRSSLERTRALPGWLGRYNWRRPHGSLGKRPPGDRLAQLTKLAGNDT
jgi:transposase InsO family protein